MLDEPLLVRSYGLTDRGQVRPRNEDQFLIAELAKTMRIRHTSLPEPSLRYGHARGYLFLVADGVGGQRGGEQASALAVGTVEDFALNALDWFSRLEGAEPQSVASELAAALAQADARISREATHHPELRGMGTTVTMAYSLGSLLFVLHVGDSRCYLLRDGVLLQLTHDHTLVEQMVRAGHLLPEQAARHQLRHIITNVVGGDKLGIDAEVRTLGLHAGDDLLLCSDGLTEMVPDDHIRRALADGDPRAACERLVREANDSGGPDNITVIAARFEAPS
jgi:protein phosphatase